MMNRIKNSLRYVLAGFPFLLVAGCHELGHLDTFGGSYGGVQQSEIAGEVRFVNERGGEIELRTDDARTETVRYDGQTRVVYRGRDYAVSNLEAGDYVAMRVQSDSRGLRYTDLVRVRESVQERGGIGSHRGRLDRVEGRVEFIDAGRGEFEIREDSGKRILITLTYSPRRADVDRLQSLRRGDYVRVEGRFLNPERLELEAFI
jgi:hypothetical protein